MTSPQEWNEEIDRLESFFKSQQLPKGIAMGKTFRINDVTEYYEANVRRAREGLGIWNVGPMQRLKELEIFIQSHKEDQVD